LPREGDPFGRYRIVRPIGEGGMAIVYDAWDAPHDRHVALKVLKPKWQREPGAVRRFLREARAAGALDHPNIVVVHDSGEEPMPFIAMQLAEGGSLAELLRHHGRLATSEAVRILRAVGEALAYAHARGRIHRDIKPSNILLAGPARTPKLGDFGIAKIAGTEETQATVIGGVLGTPRYMAPEQWRGEPIDGRSDLFSLGVTFYEMLTGERAFSADTIEALGYQVTHEPPRPVRELAPQTPPAVAAIVDRLMAKRAEDRFQDARALLAALDNPPPPPPPSPKWREGPGTRVQRWPIARRCIEYLRGFRTVKAPSLRNLAPGFAPRMPSLPKPWRSRAKPSASHARPGIHRGAVATVVLVLTAGAVAVWLYSPRWINHPPVAKTMTVARDAARVIEIDLAPAVSDPDGDRLEVAAEPGPGMPGRVRITGARLRYHPESAFARLPRGDSRSVTIPYRISDGRGGTATAEIALTVRGTFVNWPPSAAEDQARTLAGDRVSFDVLVNDHDPNADVGDTPRLVAAEVEPGGPGTVRVIDLPLPRLVAPDIGPGSPGKARIVDRLLRYDPGYTPDVVPDRPMRAAIRYTIADQAGATAEGRVRVSIEARPQPPTAPSPRTARFRPAPSLPVLVEPEAGLAPALLPPLVPGVLPRPP
jgi:serine/threonine protein kinase